MAGQGDIYVASFAGMVVLLGVFGCFIYRKHLQEVRELRRREEVVQQRRQQVIDENLPPFYVDHRRDPLCVYEHEVSLSNPELLYGDFGEQLAQGPSPATLQQDCELTVISSQTIDDLDFTALPPPPSYDISSSGPQDSSLTEASDL
ncbi:hypothetical protein EDD11_003233 [Mortierella claussenii]|nr:hypothetical protein EDD11_003233 [Mortierella claussenii]